jgi:hypothetical protein
VYVGLKYEIDGRLDDVGAECPMEAAELFINASEDSVLRGGYAGERLTVELNGVVNQAEQERGFCFAEDGRVTRIMC